MLGVGGLGASMIEGARLANPIRVFEYLIVIGLLGFIFLWGLQIVRRRILGWHPEVLQEKS